MNGHSKRHRPLARAAAATKYVPMNIFVGSVLHKLCNVLNLSGVRGTVLARDFARLNGQNFLKDVRGDIELADTSDKPYRGWHRYLPFLVRLHFLFLANKNSVRPMPVAVKIPSRGDLFLIMLIIGKATLCIVYNKPAIE